MSILGIVAPIILQLGLLPRTMISHLSSLVTKTVDRIRRLEETTDIRVYGLKRNSRRLDSTVLSLHAAHGLHVHPSFDDPLQLWGESVEMLWRTVMGFQEKHPAWETLTCRLLVWRSIVGEEGSVVGEWARREVVQNLSIHE
jgi:nucleolar pre-ribosomal-associated protein 1